MDDDEEGNDEEGVAEYGDEVLDDRHGCGLAVGLVVVDEVDAHLEELPPEEDVEDGGSGERGEAEDDAQPLHLLHQLATGRGQGSDSLPDEITGQSTRRRSRHRSR